MIGHYQGVPGQYQVVIDQYEGVTGQDQVVTGQYQVVIGHDQVVIGQYQVRTMEELVSQSHDFYHEMGRCGSVWAETQP